MGLFLKPPAVAASRRARSLTLKRGLRGFRAWLCVGTMPGHCMGSASERRRQDRLTIHGAFPHPEIRMGKRGGNQKKKIIYLWPWRAPARAFRRSWRLTGLGTCFLVASGLVSSPPETRFLCVVVSRGRWFISWPFSKFFREERGCGSRLENARVLWVHGLELSLPAFPTLGAEPTGPGFGRLELAPTHSAAGEVRVWARHW